MIRISRLTDYGIVLLSHMATQPGQAQSAADLALALRLPLPTVSKLLGLLSRAGLLESQRGAKGGYALSATPAAIPIIQIVEALEGPVALTLCSSDAASDCEYEGLCSLPVHWKRINGAIRAALEGISLAEIVAPQLGMVDGGRVAPASRPNKGRTSLSEEGL